MVHYAPNGTLNGTLNSGITPHPRPGATCHFRVIISQPPLSILPLLQMKRLELSTSFEVNNTGTAYFLQINIQIEINYDHPKPH